jgi:uncharacterized damage-inducible protein DinB
MFGPNRMTETERIADQLRRAFYGEAWSGPSVTEVLQGVTAQFAARNSLRDAHSIWELVNHITAWVDIARRRVNGEQVEVTPERNFPPVVDTSETAWNQSLQRLAQAEEALRQTILQMPESRLGETGIKGSDTVYVLLHGVVQHSLYHAGQIMLLRK